MSRRTVPLILLLAIVTVIGLFILRYLQQPERALAAAVADLGEAKTQRFNATINLENNQQAAAVVGQGKMEVTLTGGFIRPEEGERPKLDADVALTAITDSVTMQLTGKIRFVGDKIYFYVEKVPPVLDAFTELKDKWIELPRGPQGEVSSTVTDAQLFDEITYQGREKVAGDTTYHYQAKARPAAVIQAIDGLVRILGSQLTQEHIDQLRTSLQQAPSQSTDLWITPFSHELRQFAATMTATNGNVTKINATFTDRNKPLEIVAPEGAVPIDSLTPPAPAAAPEQNAP